MVYLLEELVNRFLFVGFNSDALVDVHNLNYQVRAKLVGTPGGS